MSSVWSPPVTQAKRLKRELDEKRAEASEAWQAFNTARQKAIEDGVDLAGDSAAAKALVEIHSAYKAVADQAEELEAEFMRTLDRPADGLRGRIPGIAAALLKELPNGAASLKALTSVGVITPPFFDRSIRDLPQAQQWIRTVIPTRPAESDVVSYIRQTLATHAAAPVAAHGTKPESTYELTRVDAPVRVIAHVLSGIDRSLLADQDSLEDFLDVQMRTGVLLAEQAQILNGDGTGINLRGILNTVGIATVAKGGAEPRAEAIRRAITQVQLAFLEPTAIAIHPTDLQELRLEKDADGAFLLGPAGGPGGAGDPDMLFGQLRVISTAVMPLGTALVGAFAEGATIYEREDATVAISESHGDQFVKNEVTVRAESRITLAVERPAAFCSVTAI
jgi:HK97 family phage major capsid protein